MRAIATALGVATVFLAGTAGPSSAATLKYDAVLTQLNNSGVYGRIRFTVDTVARLLTVNANVHGLEANQLHVNHVHGRFDADGNPINSELPTASDDMDHDGFVEVGEAAPKYGDILLSLEDPAGLLSGGNTGPLSDAAGNISYDRTYDLNDDRLFFNPLSGARYKGDDLLPLDLREYVIHGGTVPTGVNSSLPNGGYDITLPVAAAEIGPSQVPLPAGGLLLIGGLAGLGALRARRRAA